MKSLTTIQGVKLSTTDLIQQTKRKEATGISFVIRREEISLTPEQLYRLLQKKERG